MITSPPPAELLSNAGDDGEADRRNRALLYIRISTKRQAETDELDPDGYSLPAQRELGERKAAELGADVVEVFVDRGESAKTAERKDFLRLLAYVEEHRDIDYVILDKVDRFARNRRDDANVLFQLRMAGAQLVSVKENIDETPAGQLLHGILAAIAEYYSLNLATEALKGMTQKAKLGDTNGRAPIGYRNVRRVLDDGREIRTVEVDPDRAPLVRWAFETYATGAWTIEQLTDMLQAKGLRAMPRKRAVTPMPIHMSRVGHMLSNRYYRGDVQFRGVEYPGRQEALVSQAIFDRVQEILSSRRRAGEKQRKHRHYLKGSLFCGRCGWRLSFTRVRGNGGECDYIYCLGRHNGQSVCDFKGVQADVVERAVEDFWRSVRFPAHILERVRGDLLAKIEERRAAAGPELAAAKRRVTELESERRRLARGVIDGSVPADLAPAEYARIDREREEAERVMATAETVNANIERTLEKALDLLGRCDEVYRLAGPHDRRLANQFFFETLVIDQGGDVVAADLAEPWATLQRIGQEAPVSVGAGLIENAMVDPASRKSNRSAQLPVLPIRAGALRKSSLQRSYLW